MSVEYYTTHPSALSRVSRKDMVGDGKFRMDERERERELADGLKLDMKTPPKHESQKKRKNKQTKNRKT